MPVEGRAIRRANASRLVTVILAAAIILGFGTAALLSLPASAQAAPESFALITDTHIGAGKSAASDTKAAFAYIKKQDNLVAVINAGDITDVGSKKQYKKYLKLWKKSGIKAKRIQVLGNHDNASGGKQWWLRAEGVRGYTKNTGVKHFKKILNGGKVNTVTKFKKANVIAIGGGVGTKGGVYSKSTVKWLKKQLKKTAKQGKWAIVVTHYAPWHGTDAYFTNIPKRLNQVVAACRAYPNVIYVCGHEHVFENDKVHFSSHCSSYTKGKGKYPLRLLCLNSVTRINKGVHNGKAAANPHRHSYVYTLSISSDGSTVDFVQHDLTKGKASYTANFEKA